MAKEWGHQRVVDALNASTSTANRSGTRRAVSSRWGDPIGRTAGARRLGCANTAGRGQYMSSERRPAAGGLPTGTVTFLFSDVIGSTVLWEQAPEAMGPAMARHDALIDAAVVEHGGVVVKPR